MKHRKEHRTKAHRKADFQDKTGSKVETEKEKGNKKAKQDSRSMKEK